MCFWPVRALALTLCPGGPVGPDGSMFSFCEEANEYEINTRAPESTCAHTKRGEASTRGSARAARVPEVEKSLLMKAKLNNHTALVSERMHARFAGMADNGGALWLMA